MNFTKAFVKPCFKQSNEKVNVKLKANALI